MDLTEVRPALWAEFASLRIGDRWYVLEHTLMNLEFVKRDGEGDFRIAPLSEFREIMSKWKKNNVSRNEFLTHIADM
jgi:hypothetical protein